ncbi:hypothetical protein GO009_01415 [Muricauda sp. TY007]|uniref:collagen-like protein n=1 Tax=Allomuricauda sp. TY007 TaxID=2683200 RepID=UPI0013C1301D|nr:collagen-like protein [Muricauda sp. TY007]NDV14669.1 hypothetical protein [Muricauda sp. TY007]
MKNKAKHLLKTIVHATLCAVVALNVSCSGEDGLDGAMGPQGPAGPAGQDGQNGQDGEDGQDGQDGNANVIASDWFQLRYDDLSGANPPTWGAMIIQNDDIPELDLESFVEEGGALLVYAKIFEGPPEETDYIILSTPTTYGSLTFISGFRNFESELGLAIQVEGPDVSSLENIPNLTFRYVLVPANTVQAFNLDNENIPETFDEAAALFGFGE